MEKDKLTPLQWAMIEADELPLEEIRTAAEFYDKIVAEGEDFYKGKRLMPGQE